VHFVNDIDFEAVPAGGKFYILPQAPYLVNTPVGSPVYLQNVQAGTLGNLLTGGTAIAGLHCRALLAIQGFSQKPGRGGLPDSPGTGKEVGMGYPVLTDGVGQGTGNMFLTNHFFE